MTTLIYHNPRCSKSRQTLKLLEENGVDARVIHYLDTPPDVDELRQLLTALSLPIKAIVRTGETAFKEMNMGIDDVEEQALLEAIVENPILLQRPIVVNGERAAIGRPPESVMVLFENS